MIFSTSQQNVDPLVSPGVPWLCAIPIYGASTERLGAQDHGGTVHLVVINTYGSIA